MLKYLSKVRVEFNAFDPKSASALEFLAQCNSKKSKLSNPKCEIVVKRCTDDRPPHVNVTYSNGKEDSMDGSQLSAQQMRKTILEKAKWMEAEELFKEAGLPWPVIIPLEEIELAKKTPFKLIKKIMR